MQLVALTQFWLDFGRNLSSKEKEVDTLSVDFFLSRKIGHNIDPIWVM